MNVINKISIEEIANKLKKDGFVIVRNFLDKKEVNLIKSIVLKQCKIKGKNTNYFSTNFKTLFIKFITLNFIKFFNHNKILNLTKIKQMDALAEKYFGNKSKLHTVDGYISKISEGEILPWHTDKAYGGNPDIKQIKNFHNPNETLLKFFVYLTNVGPNDGCTSYVPYSHKIGKLIREGIFNNNINYSPYYKLKQFLEFINKEKNYHYIKKKFTNKDINFEDLIARLKKIKENEKSDFDFFAEAGDAIIFDEGGIHRGSKPTKSDRVILRFNYRIA